MTEEPSPGERIEQLQKGIRSHQERIREHQEKLRQYEEDPDSMDNQGRLRDAAKDGNLRAKIIEGRRRTLERTIERHRNEILKKRQEIDTIKRVCGSDASLRNKCLVG